jgi:hypothetical protein
MALETLKNQGHGPYVEVNHDENTIKFKIQNGPIKENGENGCQVDMLIYIATVIIRGLNKNFPCRENSLAITKLEEADLWLQARTNRRIAQGIEGTSEEKE